MKNHTKLMMIMEATNEKNVTIDDFTDFKYNIHAHAVKIKCNVNIAIFKGLKAMKDQYGQYYCPCRNIENIPEEKRAAFICPCQFHQKEIKSKGHCHCNLFIKK